MHVPLLLRSFCLLAVTIVVDAHAADRALGKFRDWDAMQFGASRELSCMAFSQPVHSDGAYTKRGEAFIFVTHRPGANERDRLSVETGYTYASGSTAQLRVGDLVLELPTHNSTAWLDNSADAQRLLQAMRAGREVIVRGTSSRGTKTEDRYSLYGFSAAYGAISKSCKAK